jgi:RNA polymerase sigma factor (sigma-70 family)
MRSAIPQPGPPKLAFSTPSAHRGGMGPLTREDHPLFARAFREHYPDLLSFVRRHVSNDAEAADIAQEAYLRVLRYRDEKDLTSLRMLVFKIAINVIGMRIRAARHQRLAAHIPLDEDLALIASTPSQDREVEATQQMHRLMAAIDKLPRKSRQALILRRFQGLSVAQTAQRMNISRNAVEVLIARASTVLRNKILKERP